MQMTKALQAWATPGFEDVIKQEIQALGVERLPLQAGLSQTSHACPGDVEVLVINTSETPDAIRVKAGIFFSGIIAGSCCADDPTPVEEQQEYCVVQVAIDKATADASVALLDDES